MRRFLSCLILLALLLVRGGAPAQMLLRGVGGPSGTCLWDPSLLAVQYKSVLNGATVAWSGSNFGTTANPGSGGGNISASTGTVVKGTQLNSLDTVAFSGSNTLELASQSWSSGQNVTIFAVVTIPADTGAIAALNWGGAGSTITHWAFYPRVTPSGSLGGSFAWGTGDTLFLTSGYVGPIAGGIFTDPVADTSAHILYMEGGSQTVMSMDGTVLTAAQSVTGTNGAVSSETVYFGGSNTSSEFGTMTVAYMYIAVSPTSTEREKSEGWAAWRFGLTGSLPGGHPYKSAPPTC